MAVQLLRKKNYLEMIRNAARGENYLFKNTYAQLEDREGDITKNGALCSGKLVSSILYLNKLIHDMHVTVEGVEKDMCSSDWRQVQELTAGCVLTWEDGNGNLKTHIGFYVGDDQAISNNAEKGLPEQHHYTFGTTEQGEPKRKILSMYWHPVLEEE